MLPSLYSKRICGVLAVLALTALFLAGCGGGSSKEAETVNKDVPPGLPVAGTAAEMPDYEAPDVCGACHSQIYDAWRGDMHAVAFEDPVYLAEAELAGKEAGKDVERFCHSCHSPAGYMRNELASNPLKSSQQAKWSIFCDFCHTVEGQRAIGNASIIPDASGPKRGPYKDSVSLFHKTAYSKLHTRAEFCGSCHDVIHPVNGLPIESTYSEWKKGPYAKKGIQCQDCHMTPGPGVTKPHPGQAANSGPQRDMVWTHDVVGGNVMMNNYYGFTEHAKMAEQRLKAAASLTLRAKLSGGNAKLDVAVKNKGAGHCLPTGLTEIRQMWLYILVTDKAGKVVYESGRLDEKRSISEGTRIFNTVLGDKDGKKTAKVWEAEKVLSDTRIPPGETRTERYSFPVAGSGLKVRAQLLYRSAPQEVLDELTGGNLNAPVIEMAEATASL